jgi:hypothetical protein
MAVKLVIKANVNPLWRWYAHQCLISTFLNRNMQKNTKKEYDAIFDIGKTEIWGWAVSRRGDGGAF